VQVVMEPDKVLGAVEIPLADVLHSTNGLLDQEYLLSGEGGELRECYVALRLQWTPASAHKHHAL
jgi:hypothetical protein